jgi:hypothetical protein
MKKTKKQELFIDLIAAIDAATIHDSGMYQANNIIHLNDQNHSAYQTCSQHIPATIISEIIK